MRVDYLYATPSAWTGVARLLDLFGRYDSYNDSETDDLADARALYSDWHIVGQDLAGAMKRMDRESKTSQPQPPAAASEVGQRP